MYTATHNSWKIMILSLKVLNMKYDILCSKMWVLTRRWAHWFQFASNCLEIIPVAGAIKSKMVMCFVYHVRSTSTANSLYFPTLSAYLGQCFAKGNQAYLLKIIGRIFICVCLRKTFSVNILIWIIHTLFFSLHLVGKPGCKSFFN